MLAPPRAPVVTTERAPPAIVKRARLDWATALARTFGAD